MLKLIRLIRPFSIYILIAWIIVILMVSSIPHLPVLKIHTRGSSIRLDYFMHFCEYCFLAFVAYLAFAGKHFNFDSRKFLLITLGLLIFAAVDEMHQRFIPGRTVNIKDLISNFSGIAATLLFCVPVFRKINLSL